MEVTLSRALNFRDGSVGNKAIHVLHLKRREMSLFLVGSFYKSLLQK